MTEIPGMIRHQRAPRVAPLVWRATVLVGVTGLLAGCGALDVSDPTAVEEQELADAAGAELLRGAALRALSDAMPDGAFQSGLLADEFLFVLRLGGAPGSTYQWLDQRESAEFEQVSNGGFAAGAYGPWQELRHAASMAIPLLRAHASAPDAKVGEMLALRGYATLRLAEDFCPGFPLHEMVDYGLVPGAPRSTEAAFTRALADFDSAVTLATDSARIRQLAQVGQGRTLLGLGRFAEAAAAVADVPTDYVARAEYLAASGVRNLQLVFTPDAFLDRSVADAEGGTGLDFVSAADPRVVLTSLGTTADGSLDLYGIAKYPNQDAPVVVASGIEARLIEAEAALQADPESGAWLAILNTLRTEAVGGVAGLAPLSDPGTNLARQDLLFRERAFWLFATGHRLADLRRLVTHYGRAADSVFPTGTYRLGGPYGTATSIPFPAARETPFNPAVTGCTSR